MDDGPRPDPTDEGPADGAPAGGNDGVRNGPAPEKDPLRFNKWMKRSATGAVMTGIALGLQEALRSPNKEVPFVIVARGEPDDPDGPIDLRFDPDSPADTVAIIRRSATGDGSGGSSPRS